jgi:cation diffusion facilitator CzcD-associated flavoprotein CzcO
MLLKMTSEEARKPESLDVAIVGAGAAGVGMGAVLADLGLDSYAILERDDVGASRARSNRRRTTRRKPS